MAQPKVYSSTRLVLTAVLYCRYDSGDVTRSSVLTPKKHRDGDWRRACEGRQCCVACYHTQYISWFCGYHIMKILKVLLLFVAASSSPLMTAAWIMTSDRAVLHPSCRRLDSSTMALRKHRVLCSFHDGNNEEVQGVTHAPSSPTRRQFLATVAAVSTTFLCRSPAVVQAAEEESSTSLPPVVDPLDQLGAALSSSSPPSAASPQQRWPENSLSPLPMPPNSTSGATTPAAGSDLEQALQGARKKRQIDPRTHG